MEVGTRGQGGVKLNRERSLEEPAWPREQWSKRPEWPMPSWDWAKPQALSGGKTTRRMVGFMKESGLIQRAGLAEGRRQAGLTCSHRHGVKCPLVAADVAQQCIPGLSLSY